MKSFFIPKKIVVPATADSLPRIREFITKVGKRYRLSKHEINALKISIDEACTNIIKHGYQDNSGNIKLRVSIGVDQMIVELIDQGKSFDPNLVCEANVQDYVSSGKKGGLGIFIMRKFLDAIDYEVTSIGNILRLTKQRQQVARNRDQQHFSATFKKFKSRLFFNNYNSQMICCGEFLLLT